MLEFTNLMFKNTMSLNFMSSNSQWWVLAISSVLLVIAQKLWLTALGMSTVYLKSHLVHVENKKICLLILSSLFHTCSGKCFSREMQFSFSIRWAFGLFLESANNRAHAGCETLDWTSKLILHQIVAIFAICQSGIFRFSDSLAGDTKLKIQSYYQSPELATPLTIFN